MAICRLCGCDPDLPVLLSWEIFIPIEPPSQNAVPGNKGAWKTRHAYAKYRDDYKLHLLAWRRHWDIPAASTKRRVILVREWARWGRHRGAERDKINNAGGMKALLDAMALAGLILGDKESQVEDHYGQVRTSDTPGVRIFLEEIQ